MKYKEAFEIQKNKNKTLTAELERVQKVLKQELDDQVKKEKERKAETEKRYAASVYCSNCKYVSDVDIPPGISINTGDCTHCRCRNTLSLVVYYPGKNIQRNY